MTRLASKKIESKWVDPHKVFYALWKNGHNLTTWSAENGYNMKTVWMVLYGHRTKSPLAQEIKARLLSLLENV